MEDRAGNLWLGTMSDGLLRFDRERRRFIRYRNHPGNPDSLAEDHVTFLLRTAKGTYGLACRTWESLSLTAGKPVFERLWQESGNPNSPNSRDGPLVTSIYEDRQGVLWIGTNTALIRIDRKTGQHTAYRSPTCVQYLCAHRSSKTVRALFGWVHLARGSSAWTEDADSSNLSVTIRPTPPSGISVPGSHRRGVGLDLNVSSDWIRRKRP